MFFKKKKSEKGVLQIDIVTGLLLFVVSSGTIITMYYNIYVLMYRLKVNQTLIGYITEICEEIDAEDYDEVSVDWVNKIIQSRIPSKYNASATIVKYTEVNSNAKDDIVKKVNIKVNYTVAKQEMNYTVYKIKVKEK